MGASRFFTMLLSAAAVTAFASIPANASPGVSDQARAEHLRIVAYWTPARASAAQPRDFSLDPATGQIVPKAKPGKPGSTLEPAWTGEGFDTVGATTGKVLFTLGTTNYVCSASVVDDAAAAKSVVVTAGHCAYDWSTGLAKNWMFIPGFDPGDSFQGCTTTDYGCWTATSLWVNNTFKGAGSFNTTAITNDFAFAVMGPSASLSTSNTESALDSAVGSQPIVFTGNLTTDLGTSTTSLGYPQAAPYDGTTLRYCQGALGADEYSNVTYRIPCGMTGGSSGGPWYSPLGSEAKGAVMSVNSYSYTRDIRTTKYNDTAMMYGPVFNTTTKTLYEAALAASAK
jgi:V8-like Glu-specific endopeptidase